jgi:hypothetical protein
MHDVLVYYFGTSGSAAHAYGTFKLVNILSFINFLTSLSSVRSGISNLCRLICAIGPKNVSRQFLSFQKKNCKPYFIVMITLLITIGIFWMVNFKTRNCHTNVKILLKMPSISRYNKVKVVTRAQYGLSHAQISIDLEIPRSTVSAILRKWRQTGTVEKRPGSGRHPVSIGDQDEALLNVIRDSPFTTTVNTANISLFPSSIRTARRGK